MKNHYDKIFLAIALFLMLASVGFFFSGNSSIDEFNSKLSSLKASGSQGESWVNKDVNTRVSKTMSWRYPKYQDVDDTWLFQVFTPPRIWIDAEGNFIAKAPKVEIIKIQEEAIPELYLADITTGKYPVSLLGYVGNLFQFRDDSNPESPIEFNGKEGEALSYKDPNDLLGKTMIDLGLKFLSAKKERVKSADGSLAEVVIVQIEDKNLGRVIELRTDKDTILEDQRKMVLVSTLDEEKEFQVLAVGEEINYNGSKYTVEEISFAEEFIVLAQVSEDSEILPSKHRLTVTIKPIIEEESVSEEASVIE